MNGLAHIRCAELCDNRPVHEFNHRMHYRLRMNHDIDLFRRDIKQPTRFDDFQSFVHQRCRIDGDPLAHLPNGMFQSLLGRNVSKLLDRCFTKWPTRGGQDQAPDFILSPRPQALIHRAVFTIDGNNCRAALFSGLP